MSDLNDFDFKPYSRRPFAVEAVMVTVANLDDIAEHVGEVQEKEDGTRFIQVDRRKVPNVFRVYPGFYLTRLDNNIRCYSPKVFNDQFVPVTDESQEWIDKLLEAP